MLSHGTNIEIVIERLRVKCFQIYKVFLIKFGNELCEVLLCYC